MASRPVLLVEGDGDRMAVPELVRRMAAQLEFHHLQPTSRPLKCGNLPPLLNRGKLERFLEYACERSDGDCVLLIVDCDDVCPAEAVARLGERGRAIAERYEKKIGLALLRREFETLFLYSLEKIAQVKGLELLSYDPNKDFEEDVRGAKEHLRGRMPKRHYKETRDQTSFTAALDLDLLSERSRSYQHLAKTLQWLAEPESGPPWVYPPPSSD